MHLDIDNLFVRDPLAHLLWVVRIPNHPLIQAVFSLALGGVNPHGSLIALAGQTSCPDLGRRRDNCRVN